MGSGAGLAAFLNACWGRCGLVVCLRGELGRDGGPAGKDGPAGAGVKAAAGLACWMWRGG